VKLQRTKGETIMNQVNIIGRLGVDVELRYTTTNQKPVAKMSVAVNDRYGENERVYWFPVICWNGLAETVSAYLHKGSRVAVTGRLITRNYDAQDGTKRYVTEIVANSVDFLDPKPVNGDAKPGAGSSNAEAPQQNAPFRDDNDIPF